MRASPNLVGVIALALSLAPSFAFGQNPTFRSSTTMVELDVIVRNAAGTFVADLQPADFEIVEDGTVGKIAAFYLVRGRDVASPAGPDAARDARPPSSSTIPTLSSPRVFVLCFDTDHMAAGSLFRARKAAAEFLKNGFHQGDLGGIVADGTMLNGRLTTVREELAAAVTKITPATDIVSRQLDMREWPRIESLYEVARIEAGDEKLIGRLVSRACADDPDRCSGSGGDDAVRHEILVKGSAIAAQARISAQRSLDTLKQLAAGLAKLPGRKTIVYLSDGFLSDRVAGELQELIVQSARANLRIYCIDTRGLNKGAADGRLVAAGPQQRVFMSRDVPADLPQFDVESDGLNSLAVDTGGLFIRNENDFPRALREVAADTGSYYVLGYQPTVPRDGRFHAVRVRLKRPGLTARARKGYIASAENASPETPTIAEATKPKEAVPAPAPANAPTAAPANTPSAAPPDTVPGPPGAHAEPPPARISAISTAAASGPGGGLEAVRLRPIGRAPLDDATSLRNERQPVSTGAPMPESAMAQAREGWTAYQRGDTKTALTLLAAPAEDAAAPPWVNYVLGWAAFAEGQWVTARNAWNVVRATVPDFLPAYFDIADAYLRQSKAPEALVVLRAAQSRWPTSIDVLNAVGIVQTSTGQLDDAIGTFQKALATEPGDVTARFNLAGARELRYVGSLRQTAPADNERAEALDAYRRVADSPGPFAEAARAGVRRLAPLDARSLKCAAPVPVATLAQTVLHGQPVRLAWSLDGEQIYMMGMSAKTEGHVLVATSTGAVTQVAAAPDWTRRYWSWKAGQKAPWLPSLMIKSETTRVTNFNMTDPGNKQRAYAPSGGQSTSSVLLLHNEIVAQAAGSFVIPGLTFSWSPFAMGALAFVTPRNRLVIIDSQGRKIEVAGTHDVLLPAWSEDGTQIAYLVPAGNKWILQRVVLSRAPEPPIGQ